MSCLPLRHVFYKYFFFNQPLLTIKWECIHKRHVLRQSEWGVFGLTFLDICNLSHLRNWCSLRAIDVMLTEISLSKNRKNINVLCLKSDTPCSSINPEAWHALISIGTHFPLSNLLPHSDPVFTYLVWYTDRQAPSAAQQKCSETRRIAGIAGLWVIVFLLSSNIKSWWFSTANLGSESNIYS